MANTLLEPTKRRWRQIVSEHSTLWERALGRLQQLERSAWDVLICRLELKQGGLFVYPAGVNAPFAVPQSPQDDCFPEHFDELVNHGERLTTAEFDARRGGALPNHEQLYQLRCRRVRALSESLSTRSVKRVLKAAQSDRPFGIFWTPDTDTALCVHLERLYGPDLPSRVPATTAFAAMAPLFWRKHSFVGSNHGDLELRGAELVRATLSGPRVDDTTFDLLTPDAAAACHRLQELVLRETAVTARGVARLRRLLPRTRITVG